MKGSAKCFGALCTHKVIEVTVRTLGFRFKGEESETGGGNDLVFLLN